MHGVVNDKSLLDRPQQILYGRLVRAFPGHVVLARVAMTRVFVADFVVCRPDFTPLAAVELDDGTKSSSAAHRERDRRRTQVLQAAGIKVVRLSASDIPAECALKALIAAIPLNATTDQLMRRAS